MIFLTYIINEPHAVSCAVHMGLIETRTPVPFSSAHPSVISFCSHARSVLRAIPPACYAHGGISCAHNRASLTNNPLDGTTLRGSNGI